MADRPPRTVLEQRIRQQCMTFEEFVQHAETFARDNHETGTLSLRHLQRLVSGKPVGALRPATARLLEQLLGAPIATLLAPPRTVAADDEDPATELRRLLHAARRIDRSTITLLHQQLDAIRRLDRQLGAIVVRDELNAKIRQVQRLTAYSLAPGTREPLAGLLSEMHTLAGWQALDLGDVPELLATLRALPVRSRTIRLRPTRSPTLPPNKHSSSSTPGRPATRSTCSMVPAAAPTHPRPESCEPGWPPLTAKPSPPTATKPPACTPSTKPPNSYPSDPADERPYVALDPVHLARWRGHALARFGHPDAITVLTDALNRLDRSFVRAEAALRIDLATALAASGNQDEASEHARRAHTLAAELGSTRQRRRLQTLAASLPVA